MNALCGRRDGSGYGKHTIGFLGGLCLMANNICGSAMVQLPGLLQGTGWLASLLIFVIIAGVTTLASLQLVRTISLFPGNAALKERYEFGRISSELLPRWASVLSLLTLCLTFTATNVSNIIVSSQVMDDVLLAVASRTCALTLYPQASGVSPFTCIQQDSDNVLTDSPFGSAYVISLGFILVGALTVPMSYLNLDDNVVVQVFGMFTLTLCCVVWCLNFCVLGLVPAQLPAFGTGGPSAFTGMVPTIVFNYGFVATVPSFVSEKSPLSSSTTTLCAAVALATALYISLGVLGAMALPPGGGTDLLSVIVDGEVQGIWNISVVAAYIFPAANLMTSIPVFCVIVRYNLLQLGLPVWAAQLLAIGVPWLLSLVFYSGNQLTELINWSSALLFAALNVLIPSCFFLAQSIRTGDGAPLQPGLQQVELDEHGCVDMLARASRLQAQAAAGAHDDEDAATRSEKARGLLEDAVLDPVPVTLSTASLNADAGAPLLDTPASHAEEGVMVENVHSLPRWVRAYVSERYAAYVLVAFGVALWGTSLGLQAYGEYENDTGGGS